MMSFTFRADRKTRAFGRTFKEGQLFTITQEFYPSRLQLAVYESLGLYYWPGKR